MVYVPLISFKKEGEGPGGSTCTGNIQQQEFVDLILPFRAEDGFWPSFPLRVFVQVGLHACQFDREFLVGHLWRGGAEGYPCPPLYVTSLYTRQW